MKQVWSHSADVVLANNVCSFEHSRNCTTTTSDGRRETENLTPSYLGPLAISDQPLRPTGRLRPDVLPSSDKVVPEPEPPTHYVLRDADPGFEDIRMGEEPRVLCEAESLAGCAKRIITVKKRVPSRHCRSQRTTSGRTIDAREIGFALIMGDDRYCTMER